MADAREIVTFWFETCTPDQWYAQDDALDATIRERFGADVAAAQEGAFEDWRQSAEGALGLLILIDQFSRNIYRGDARSFAGDARAREIARAAIAGDFDQAFDMPARQFFFLPFVHSEDLADQDEGIRLMQDRLGPEGADNIRHAKVHREIIRRFGRFPYRNAALGRETTAEEQAFLDNGGYGAIARELGAD